VRTEPSTLVRAAITSVRGLPAVLELRRRPVERSLA
jgi:hypothetical protein